MNNAKVYQLHDDIFPGTQLMEALNQKDLVRSVAWLCEAGRVQICDDALDIMKGRVERSLWAKAYKSKHFVRL